VIFWSCLKTVEIPFFAPAIGGGERHYQLILATTDFFITVVFEKSLNFDNYRPALPAGR
jgi:hypothetical protein